MLMIDLEKENSLEDVKQIVYKEYENLRKKQSDLLRVNNQEISQH